MIDALYFDGQSTRCQRVSVLLHNGVMVLRGAGIERSMTLSQWTISEPLARAPRMLQSADGATLQIDDARFTYLLRKNGYVEHWTQRWQQNWGIALGALVSLLLLFLAGYQWGLPWCGDRLARHMPARLERRLGDAQLALLDAQALQPSRLDPLDQQRLRSAVTTLRQSSTEPGPWRLEFRHSQLGPQAFALTNGVIILTDQLVMLAHDDATVLGLVAHQLGHLQQHHALRRRVQNGGIGALVQLALGGGVSDLTAVLQEQTGTREFEREADQFAIALMHASQLPLQPLAQLLAHKGQANGMLPAVAGFFRSHPSDGERIARLRAADAP